MLLSLFNILYHIIGDVQPRAYKRLRISYDARDRESVAVNESVTGSCNAPVLDKRMTIMRSFKLFFVHDWNTNALLGKTCSGVGNFGVKEGNDICDHIKMVCQRNEKPGRDNEDLSNKLQVNLIILHETQMPF